MSQTLFYKILLILFLLTNLLAIVHKPKDQEQKIKLEIQDNFRTYYEIDNNGLTYENIGKGFNLGDSIQVAIYSRTIKAPTGKKNRNYGFIVQINNDNPIELKYQKEGSKVISPDRPGWNYTKSGIWYFYIPLKKLKNTIKIKPLIGNSVVYIRLISKLINRDGTYGDIIKTVNRQERISIKTIGKKKSTRWYALDKDNLQQFEIKGPAKIRVFTRLKYYEYNTSNNYYIFVREDGIDLGTYYFQTEKSYESMELKNNYSVGKWRSFWLNVPDGKHYYNISLSDILDNQENTVYIRLKTWLQE